MVYLSCSSVRYANTFTYYRATRTVQRSTGPREREVGGAQAHMQHRLTCSTGLLQLLLHMQLALPSTHMPCAQDGTVHFH
jgi:hypothetical protein